MFKIESYVTPILLSYVDKYVKDFNPADAQVSLWGGGVALHNLVIKTDVLQQEVSLPFALVSGRIHELLIQVPWTKIMSEPIVVTIDIIECILSLRPALSEETQAAEAPPLTSHRQRVETPPGYMQALVRRIVSNISIKVHHLILKYVQDDVVMSLNIKHLCVQSTDTYWQPSFADIDQSKPKIRRLVTIDDLTLCLDSSDADGKIRFYQEPLLYRCRIELRVLMKLESANNRRASYINCNMYSEKLAFSITSEQLVLFLRLVKEQMRTNQSTPKKSKQKPVELKQSATNILKLTDKDKARKSTHDTSPTVEMPTSSDNVSETRNLTSETVESNPALEGENVPNSSLEIQIDNQGQSNIQSIDENLSIDKTSDVPTSAVEPLPTSTSDPPPAPLPSEPASAAAPSTTPAAAPPATPAAAPTAAESAPAAEISLDPTLLAALGESTSDTPEFGASIHDSLANLWLPLLKKGMTKENKEKLLKEYLIPSNCKLLQAPKLNAEISAAVPDVVRGRDKKYVTVQQQLGQGITAINRAMDVMLKSDNKIEALKYLSDGCRILSDLHNFFTKDRTKLITPSLDKNFLHVIQDAERDELLFGNALSEKIKASKAIEKQGQQIKKNVSTSKANTQNTTTVRPSTSQGNWSGPPRCSSNRGGGGGRTQVEPSAGHAAPVHHQRDTSPPAAGSDQTSFTIFLLLLVKSY